MNRTDKFDLQYKIHYKNLEERKVKRLYVDMDGTLNKWRQAASLEELYSPNFFLNAEPHPEVLEAIRQMIKSNQAEVHILSAVLTDSQHAVWEKEQWLQRYLPEIEPENIHFTACGQSKADNLPTLTADDYLLDDYTKNLSEWKSSGGTSIKLINDVNNTHGTWMGAKVEYHLSAEELYRKLSLHMDIHQSLEVERVTDVYARKPEKKIENRDYSNQDLRSLNFENQYFANCNFDGAVLDKTVFRGSTFTECSFIDAKMNNVDFTNATINYSDFRFAELQGSCFNNASIRSSHFHCCNLESCNMLLMKAQDANFYMVHNSNIMFLNQDSFSVRAGTPSECEQYQKRMMKELSKPEGIVNMERQQWAAKWIKNVNSGKYDRTKAFNKLEPKLQELKSYAPDHNPDNAINKEHEKTLANKEQAAAPVPNSSVMVTEQSFEMEMI